MNLYLHTINHNRRIVRTFDGWSAVSDGRYSDPRPITTDQVLEALMARIATLERVQVEVTNELNRATINKERAVRCEFCGSVCSIGIDAINLMPTALGHRISAPVVVCECCWEHDEDLIEKIDPYLSEQNAHAEMSGIYKAIAAHYWAKEEPEFSGVQIDNAVQMLHDCQFTRDKDMGPWIRNPNTDAARRWLHRIEVQ